MNVGEKVEITITDLTADGAGFGKLEGCAVFVQGALPGDRVTAEITKAKKNYTEAKLLEIVQASEDRCESACRYAGKCGGCAMQGYKYDAQLRLKQRQVTDKLTRIGELENPVLRPIVGAGNPYGYRNKAEYPAYAGKNQDGAPTSIVGCYERKSHKIVDVKACMLQTQAADAVAGIVREYNKGEIKQVIVKTAFGTGEVMVILECQAERTKYLEGLVYAIDDKLEELGCGSLESVYTLWDDKYKLAAGKKTITDEWDNGLKFEISAPSFYQVNTAQMQQLYAVAAEYAGLTGDELVLDLYCGIGTIGLSMADKARQIIGIEIVKEAVIDANRNATINGILNARYICGPAEEVLPLCADPQHEHRPLSAFELLAKELADAKAENRDIVAILDPPRAGCDEALLRTISESAASRIVYISCDAATLARDVKLLGEMGWHFEEATPVDMFPNTMHVETVVLLTKVHN